MKPATLSAPAKVNLCLFLGPARPDGRHELVTLFEPAAPEDRITVTPSDSGADEVECPGVPGHNLVSDALAGLRELGWAAPPVRVEIEKRIPVAAGMGGGSADAAAILRIAESVSPVAPAQLYALATRLGADVASQIDPVPQIGTGFGEVLERARVAEHALLIVPHRFALSTAEVFREADRLGLPRSAAELAELHRELAASLGRDGQLPAPLIVNDLQPAALSLRPELQETLDLVAGAGADHVLVCGSGPTVIGIFWGERLDAVSEVAERLRDRFPRALATRPAQG